jgi:hypothetical protein
LRREPCCTVKLTLSAGGELASKLQEKLRVDRHTASPTPTPLKNLDTNTCLKITRSYVDPKQPLYR